jgi:subfamily B ATP-binding cassette protein MsbA
MKLASLRNLIAVVSQEMILFNDTVQENIKYGRRDASNQEIVQAAKEAHAYEFIMSLPKKFDTVIGDRGFKLSGGEKQRIAIARAILKDAPILILDEATSQLDSHSEKLIQGALANLIKGKTVFVIAHRLSTVQNSSRIIVLDKGVIVEEGRHETLLKESKIYKRLHELQFNA